MQQYTLAENVSVLQQFNYQNIWLAYNWMIIGDVETVFKISELKWKITNLCSRNFDLKQVCG